MVLLASVVTVRVATDVVRRVARRVVLLPASLLPSSVVDSVVAVVLLLRHRGMHPYSRSSISDPGC